MPATSQTSCGGRSGGSQCENNDCWHWHNDIDYIEKLMQALNPGRSFVLIADDWGSGIASHYAARHNDRLLALIQLDAIAFNGYPVNEIQAIGRASAVYQSIAHCSGHESAT